MEILLEMEQINFLQSLISVQLSSAMFTTTLAQISHFKSLMSTAESYFSVFELYSSKWLTYYVFIVYF